MVPHLSTALTGPLLALEQLFLDRTTEIEQWLRDQWLRHKPPFYSSVDLRNAGFKLSPIDTNLFPGGFNNLSPALLPLAVQATMTAIEHICPKACNLLLVPENHTRNAYYLQNVARLAQILRLAGLNVRVGSLLPEITAPTPLTLPDGQTLLLEPMLRQGGRLGLADYDPCAILLNNDLSAGVPGILQGLSGQAVLPPLHAGWATRRKSRHFVAYSDVARDFSDVLGIDSWLIEPCFGLCEGVDFHSRQGEDCLANAVAAVLDRVRSKYQEYGVADTPYVVLKADSGTYGMGIMTVRDAVEVRDLNRKQRNKMAVIKDGQTVHQVLIQEGVHTSETIGEAAAEPVAYLVDRFVVGGFYRVHKARGRDENLNAPGMHFEPLAFETCCSTPDPCRNPDAPPNRFYAYGVVARLAALAAAIEIERSTPRAESAAMAA